MRAMVQDAIHPTAIVEEGAELGAGVTVGAYAIIGADVRLGDGVTLHPHSVIGGHTEIGHGGEIFPFASIGLRPQDMKYGGEPSRLIIGANAVIREHVTINPGTEGGGMVTRIGDGCLIMIGAHVAHDCLIGDHVILANNVGLGGHVTIGDHVIMGGFAVVHQFVQIGAHAIIGGMSAVDRNIIPYGLARGGRATLNGLNIVGMKRRDIPREQIARLQATYKLLFEGEGTLRDGLRRARAEQSDDPRVAEIIEFVAASKSVCQPRPATG